MVLANRTRVQNSRTLLRAFGGPERGLRLLRGRVQCGDRFFVQDFPALSTRKPRRKLRTLTGLNGMYHLNGLLTVCGKDLVYTPDDGGGDRDLHRCGGRQQKGAGGSWHENFDLSGQGRL